MEDRDLLERVTVEPEVMVGKPVIRGTRLTVEHVLNLMAQGMSSQEILDEYEGLAHEDVQACLLFASKSLENNAWPQYPLYGGDPTIAERTEEELAGGPGIPSFGES